MLPGKFLRPKMSGDEHAGSTIGGSGVIQCGLDTQEVSDVPRRRKERRTTPNAVSGSSQAPITEGK